MEACPRNTIHLTGVYKMTCNRCFHVDMSLYVGFLSTALLLQSIMPYHVSRVLVVINFMDAAVMLLLFIIVFVFVIRIHPLSVRGTAGLCHNLLYIVTVHITFKTSVHTDIIIKVPLQNTGYLN